MGTSHDEVTTRRVDAKVARSNERLANRYNESEASRRNVSIRVKYLQSQVLRHG